MLCCALSSADAIDMNVCGVCLCDKDVNEANSGTSQGHLSEELNVALLVGRERESALLLTSTCISSRTSIFVSLSLALSNEPLWPSYRN